MKSIVVQRVALGEPDSSGRRRPVPIDGADLEIPVSAVVVAVSQEPDWTGLEDIKLDHDGATGEGWVGIRDDLLALVASTHQ